MYNEDQESGFISHLTELRKRLINSFIFLIIFFIGCYVFAENIYGFLVEPFAQAVKMRRLSDPSSFTAFANGSTKKPYKCSAKK